MKTLKIIKKVLVIFTLLIYGFCQAQTENNTSEMENFDKMANYLTKGSGKWSGDNLQYNSDNPRSPKAFGLWFERPINNLLTLKVVSYLKDTIKLSSQGIFSWHPVKKQFIHITADRGNGFSEGLTEFPNDTTFISTMIVYRPNGRSFDHKDENFIVNENVHRNTSFKKDKNGKWIENGNWIWTRDPEK